jgi:superfamily II DNA/RNA helicase
MVFFPTARQTAYTASLFNTAAGYNVLEIHSRKTQGARTRTSEQFRGAKKGVMFSSDVTARGLDYPDVTLVRRPFLPSFSAPSLSRERAACIHGEGKILWMWFRPSPPPQPRFIPCLVCR